MCLDVELKGDITIGPGTVVHPKASIYAIDYARNNFEEDGNMDGMILCE